MTTQILEHLVTRIIPYVLQKFLNPLLLVTREMIFNSHSISVQSQCHVARIQKLLKNYVPDYVPDFPVKKRLKNFKNGYFYNHKYIKHVTMAHLYLIVFLLFIRLNLHTLDQFYGILFCLFLIIVNINQPINMANNNALLVSQK